MRCNLQRRAVKLSKITICRINAGTDIINDIVIINRHIFSVSQDKTSQCASIKGLRKKRAMNADDDEIDSVATMQIYKDSEYPLLSVSLNHKSKELVFGSRKCVLYERNHLVTIKHKFGAYVHLSRTASKKKKKKKKTKFILSADGNDDAAKHKTAKWYIQYLGKNNIRIRSRKNGKYLRMIRKGTVIDLKASDDPRETDNIFKWNSKKKTIQSVKYKDAYLAVDKSLKIIPLKEKKINSKNVCTQFELVEVEKNKKFDSFFEFISEPATDLDRICNLKSRRDKRTRKHFLSVQRTDINNVKIFDLDKKILIKRIKIREDEKFIFRIYDSGLSFDQRFSVLAVGIFRAAQNKKAIAFSLKGLNISKNAKKITQNHSFSDAV